MKMKSREYWERMLTMLEEAQLAKGDDFYRELEEIYRKTLDNIEKVHSIQDLDGKVFRMRHRTGNFINCTKRFLVVDFPQKTLQSFRI